jgi:hypothetical protein
MDDSVHSRERVVLMVKAGLPEGSRSASASYSTGSGIAPSNPVRHAFRPHGCLSNCSSAFSVVPTATWHHASHKATESAITVASRHGRRSFERFESGDRKSTG